MIALLALFLAVTIQPVNAETHGYSMSFQGVNPVAGMREPQVNWTNKGMSELYNATSFSISGWFKWESGVKQGAPFMWYSSSKKIVLEYTGIEIMGYFIPWEKLPTDSSLEIQQREKWNFLAVVIHNGVVTTYLNGKLGRIGYPLESGKWSHSKPLSDLGISYFLVGANLEVKVPLSEYARSDGYGGDKRLQGFKGRMDEFTIWAKDLSIMEIQQLMKTPLNPNAIPDEAILYYNFDVSGCTNSSLTLYEDFDCEITGNRVIKNLGLAASGYDLLLGKLNNDTGFGDKYTWTDDYKSSREVYTFDIPTISLDVPPDLNHQNMTRDYAFTPSSVQLRGNSSTKIQFPKGYSPKRLLTIPLHGYLFKGSNVSIQVNTSGNLSSETFLWYYSPTAGFMEKGPMLLKFLLEETINGTATEHDVHVWPYSKPKIVSQSPQIKSGVFQNYIREGQWTVFFGKFFCYSDTGESLDMKIVSYPQHASPWFGFILLRYDEVVSSSVRRISTAFLPMTEVISDELGFLLMYFPSPGYEGTDSMKIKFISPESGLESEILDVKFKMTLIDDLPSVQTINDIVVEEDSVNGTLIPLEATDQENHFGLYVAVTTLPAKGKLYQQKNNEGNITRRLIDRPYNLHDNGNVFHQFATEVLNVSSFEISEFDETKIAYHPMQALGPLNCKGYGFERNDCTESSFHETPKIGLIYLVNIYKNDSPLQDESKVPHFLPAKIIAVHGSSWQTGTVDVELLQMYKNIGEEMIPCILLPNESGESIYPSDCSVDSLASVQVPMKILNVGINDVKDTQFRGWAPWFNSKGKVTNTVVEGGVDSAIYGERFIFKNNQMTTYNNLTDHKYTEFIEFRFDQAVYPLSLEVGFPTGGGAIVSIKAQPENEKEWVTLYAGMPQRDKYANSVERSNYFYFEEKTCRQSFKTNTVRLELDTSLETGIHDFILLDFIKLTGSGEIQPSVVNNDFDSIVYIPDENCYGKDQFEYTAWDCGGSLFRASDPGVVSINIEPRPDLPLLKSLETIEHTAFCLQNSFTGGSPIDVRVIVTEVDDESTVHRITKMPTNGVVKQNGKGLALNDTLLAIPGTMPNQRVVELQYTPVSACGNPLYLSEVNWNERFDLIAIEVMDTSNSSASVSVKINIVKENRNIDSSYIKMSISIFFANLGLCIGGFIWVVYYRNHPIVIFSKKSFLYSILLGSLLSAFVVPVLSTSDGEYGQSLNTAISACRVLPWISSAGFLMTFTPLVAKLYHLDKNKQLTKEEIDQGIKGPFYSSEIIKRYSPVILLEIIILLSWEVIAPLTYIRYPLRFYQADSDFVLESKGLCSSENGYDIYFVAALVSYHFIVLTIASYLAVKTFSMKADKWSESKCVRGSILSAFQIFFFNIPTMVTGLQNHDPQTKSHVYYRMFNSVFLYNGSVLVFILLPKMKYVVHFKQVMRRLSTARQSTFSLKRSSTIRAMVNLSEIKKNQSVLPIEEEEKSGVKN